MSTRRALPPGLVEAAERGGLRGSRARRRRRRGGGGPAGRVWVIGPDGKTAALALQLGIGDGTYTEVAGGELKEGHLVIVGVAVPGDRTPAQTGAAPRLRF